MKSLIHRRSLIVRLLLLSVAAVALPALLISAIYRSISSRALLESIQEQQTELARRIAEEVNDEVRQAQSLVAIVAQSSFFSAGSRVDQYEALHHLLQSSPAFQEVMLTAASGTEILKVSRQGGPQHLLRRYEDLRQSYIGLPFFSANRAPTILLGEPIRSFANPQHTGALLAKMSFTTLGLLVRQAAVGPHGIAYIVDSRGTLLAHPDENLVLAHTTWSSRRVVQSWLSASERPTILTRDRDPQGAELLSIAYPIPLLKSAVVIQQPKVDVYAPLDRMRQEFIRWTLASVVVFLILTLAIAWKILKPLRQLRAAVEEVGQGKREIHLDIHTNDELEDLATTFERMTQSLGELERMRRDLINMVVHDLKMPLSTILPSLDSLLAGDFGTLEKNQAHFVQMARRSGHEMLMLIQNLLDVAKMEEGKLTLHPEPFIAGDWARSVVANFQPLADSAKKKLSLEIAYGIPALTGDVPLLSRVLGNFISNALRHSAPVTGEVTVSLYQDGSQLAVEIRDNGEGISEAEQKYIFDRFIQGKESEFSSMGGAASFPAGPSGIRGGTGLGLTFCKMIVEAHEGHITVFSRPKEGSVFTFRLPLPIKFSEADPKIAVPSTD
jgi:signal transduction histidine kinase